MDEIRTSVVNNVLNGQYYVDARNWYARKYVYPIIERSFMAVLAASLLCILIYAAVSIYSLYPNVINIDLVTTIDDSIDYQPKIIALPKHRYAKPNAEDGIANSPYVQVAKYLVSNYVKNRESYDYSKLQEQMDKVQNSSTKFMYKQFYHSLSLSNPSSPVLLYQQNMTRNIEIKSIRALDENNFMVQFNAQVIQQEKNISNTSWVANITFSMSDVNISKSKENTFNFIVTDYKVQQIR